MTDMVYEACKILRTELVARAPENRLSVVADGIVVDYVRGKVRVSTSDAGNWVEEAVKDALPVIKRILNGKVTKEDAEKVIKKYGKFQKVRTAGAGRKEK